MQMTNNPHQALLDRIFFRNIKGFLVSRKFNMNGEQQEIETKKQDK